VRLAGQSWQWDDVRFVMLHPLAADYQMTSKNPNNMSCVLRVSTAAGSVLLTADIEAVDERALLARSPALLRSEVLLAPHHGGNRSSTPEFIAAVDTHDVVFSAGYRNSFRHPRPEVIERYAASRQWRTDRDGTLHIVLAGTPEVSAWRSERRRYWYGR
jgi:competence protein ComEC